MSKMTDTICAVTLFHLLMLMMGISAMVGTPARAEAEVVDLMELATAEGWPHNVQEVWGPAGPAWHFEGTRDSYVPIRGLSFSESYTFEAWIRFDPDATEGKATLLSSDRYRRYRLHITEGENINLEYRDTNKSRSSFSANFTFEPGRWYHLAISFSPAQGIAFYVDGGLIKTQLPPIPAMASFPVAAVGAFSVDRGVYDHPLHGSIGTPKLYRRALSAEEVHEIYQRDSRVPDTMPVPQSVVYHDDKPGLEVAQLTHLVLEDGILNPRDPTVELLQSHLRERVNQNVRLTPTRAAGQTQIVIRKGDIAGSLNPDTAYEAYALKIADGIAEITAPTPRGAAYGIHTLIDMMGDSSQTLPAMEIRDWPAFSFRGFLYLCHREPPAISRDSFQSDMRKLIPQLSRYRINHLLVRTADWIYLDDPAVEKSAEELFAYAAKHHVDIVPLSRSYGHAKQWLHRDLRTGHTIMQKDEAVQFTGTDAVALKVPNVIVTQNTPIVVTSQRGRTYEEGVDYQVIEGTLETSWKHPPNTKSSWSRPHVLDNEPWRLKRLADGSIGDGETVLVTYDTSRVVLGQGQGAYCPFSEFTREIQSESIARMTRLMKKSGLDSKYINLGLDEIWVLRGDDGRCCTHNDWSNEKTFVYEINKLDKEIREHRPNTSLMMWSDMLDPRQTPGWKMSLDYQAIMDSELSREVIMMPWLYYTSSEYMAMIRGSLRFLIDEGFGIAGTSGHEPLNNLLWGESLLYARDTLGGEVHGLLYTTWAHSKGDTMGGLPAFAQATWSPGQVQISGAAELFECLRQAGLHTNPGQQALMDDISDENIGKLDDYGFIKPRLQMALAQTEIDMAVMGSDRLELLRRAGFDIPHIYELGRKLLAAMGPS